MRARWVCLAVLLWSSFAFASEGERRSHSLWLYARTGLSLYLSPTKTQGGLGGGFGVRDVISDAFLVQADASYLTLLGNVAEVRLGAGVQRPGTWSPAALVTGSILIGEGLSFLTAEHPYPSRHPRWSLGVELSPFRFSSEKTSISVLPLGIGWGLELPGVGWHYKVGLLEVATRF